MKTICEKSMSGKTWVVDGGSETDIIEGILAKRGIRDPESRRIFLNPSLHEQMPDPSILKGIDSAVGIVSDAVRAGKKIAVFGDYDVDGITSTAILIKFFRAVGVDAVWHLPDRESEGYGLNESSVHDFCAVGAEVLITVDCGISAAREVAVAKRLGMSVVITDHHEPGGDPPPADAIVNPKQGGDESGMTYLAGVGVAFMFLIALNRRLGHPVPDMMRFLDLVALGTICDTMPLVGLNRAIAASGLKVLDKRQNVGLKVLMDKAGVREADVYTAGFVLGPRLNAAGRITDAALALDLILTDNYMIADDLAEKLNGMNAKRQLIQNAILIDAEEQAKKQAENGAYCLYVSGADWHGGVVGIVAGRLKEKYGRPCCIATKSGGIVNGSGRSIEGVDLGKIIHMALTQGIITGGGGHAAAAGFDLAEENERAFIDFLNENISSALGGSHPVPKINVDAEMDAGGADWDLAENLSRLAPFGMGNPEPVLCLSGGMWTYGRTMGSGAHLSGTLKTGAGNLPVVGFHLADSAAGRFLLDESNFGSIIKVVGKLKKNNYRGGGVQLFLEDVAL